MSGRCAVCQGVIIGDQCIQCGALQEEPDQGARDRYAGVVCLDFSTEKCVLPYAPREQCVRGADTLCHWTGRLRIPPEGDATNEMAPEEQLSPRSAGGKEA